MFEKETAALEQLGAAITTGEIKQQPELWQKTMAIYKDSRQQIETFLQEIKKHTKGKIRVIFTGAGTSQYVGDTLVPYLTRAGDNQSFIFESIGTTDIVAAPYDYLLPEETTILVSFARSGNSPESLSAVEIASNVVQNIFHLTITCAAAGQLAVNAEKDEKNLLLLMPAEANDKGFAMTGSFTCMTLTALLIFDQIELEKKIEYVEALGRIGREIVHREKEITGFLAADFNRIIYLGSGALKGLTREAQLKVLELTAGKVATVFDSSMGFRHGPKSFVDEKTLVFVFLSNDAYGREYDVDILEEVYGDQIAAAVVGIGQPESRAFSGSGFLFGKDELKLAEAYLALADAMVAQTIALNSSIKVQNTPDTPSPTGTVNRVVQGVTIHNLN